MKLIAVIFLMSLSSVLAGLKGARPESDIGKFFDKDLMPGIQNITQCMYKPVDKTIGCRTIGGEVECPAFFEWPTSNVPSFKVFGLGIIPEFANAKTDVVKYWLYPRLLDNITYVDHMIMVNGFVHDVFLYYGEKFTEYGFRVTDDKCFGRLKNLFQGSSVEHMMPIESGFIVNPVVPMIGEVLVFDKDVSKRWLWGGWPLFAWNPLFYGGGLWGR